MRVVIEMSSSDKQSGDAPSRIPYPNPGWARLLSILMAVALAALVLVYPRAVATSVSDVNHGLLNLLMWGIAIGFIHGVGFIPRMAIWRVVFNPILGWPLMLFGIGLTLMQS